MNRPTLRQRKKINYKDMVNFQNIKSASSDEEYANDAVTESDEEDELFSKKKPKLVTKVTPTSDFVSVLEKNKITEEEASNEYRKERQQNMKDRLMVLQTIDFDDDVRQLQSIAPVKVTPVRKLSTPREKSIQKPNLSVFKRRSARLLKRSLVQSENENDLPLENVDTSSHEYEEEEIADNLKLFETEEDIEFYERLKTLNIPYDSISDFNTCDFDKFKQTIRSCFMFEEPTKVIASRISALDFHRSETELLIVVGDKMGNVSLANLNDKSQTQRKCHTRSTHCVSFGKQDGTKFFSTSLDGTVRQGDVNSNNLSIIYNSPNDHTTWHDERNNSLLIAEGKGNVQVIDLRVPINSKHLTYSFPTRSVRTVQTHPLNEHNFLTSSGSGYFGIWDDRNFSAKNAQPLTMVNFRKALSSAFFSYNGNRVLTTGVDDTVRVYDCTDNIAKEISCVLHNNRNGRFLSVFKAKWQPQRDDCFFVGSLLSNPRRIQVYNATNGTIIHNLTSDAMNTISPVLAIHHTKPIIIGGNSSGKVHIFSPFRNLSEK